MRFDAWMVVVVVSIGVACVADCSTARAETRKEQIIRLYGEGKYAAATELAKAELADNFKALGPDHPGTALSLNNLALLYYTQGKYDEAKPYYERALAIYEKALGPDHPSTAQSLNNLARLREEQSKAAANAK